AGAWDGEDRGGGVRRGLPGADAREAIMTDLGHEQRGTGGRRPASSRHDATIRTTAERAAWSAATMAAILAVLFLVFFGINSQHTNESRMTATSRTALPATHPAASGQGGAPSAPETTGQR